MILTIKRSDFNNVRKQLDTQVASVITSQDIEQRSMEVQGLIKICGAISYQQSKFKKKSREANKLMTSSLIECYNLPHSFALKQFNDDVVSHGFTEEKY